MIRKTTNYDLFKPNPDQRPYNEDRVRFLAGEMGKYGFPESAAVSCYRSGNELVLNTGHHRVGAARLAKVPVSYVVEDRFSKARLVSEGTSARNWKCGDVVSIFAKEGNKHYQALLSYSKKGIPIKMAASLLIGQHASSGNATAYIAAGTFKVKTTAHIDAIVSVIEELKNPHSEVTSLVFIAALSALLMVPDFSTEQMISRIRAVGSLAKCATRNQMLEQLDEIYNFRSRQRQNISFQAKEALRERNAVKPKTA